MVHAVSRGRGKKCRRNRLLGVALVCASTACATTALAFEARDARCESEVPSPVRPRRVASALADRGEPPPPEELDVDGAPPVYYYPPKAREGARPVLLYLHGRGGNPANDCQKWSRVAREFGWLVCPSGPEDRGGGARAWANNWLAARTIVDKTMDQLVKQEGRRVRRSGNTIIGFSEGAFIAMNIGVREPNVFNRWLILAANDGYWGGEGEEALEKNARRIRRVYLMTGQSDGVLDATQRVFELLDGAGVHVIMRAPEDLGHEVPEERMRRLYHRPLSWLSH